MRSPVAAEILRSAEIRVDPRLVNLLH